MSAPQQDRQNRGLPIGGQFATMSHPEDGTIVLDGPTTVAGLTAPQHQAQAHAAQQSAAESWERSDTDGFLSQYASGLSAQVHSRQAAIAEAGGKLDFQALFDTNGRVVAAKRIQGKFGPAWALLESDDPSSRFTGYVNTSEAQDPGRRARPDAKKGYYVGRVLAPANARLAGGGTGMSGMASVFVQTYRTDGGFDRNADIVDNGQTPAPAIEPVPAAPEPAPAPPAAPVRNLDGLMTIRNQMEAAYGASTRGFNVQAEDVINRSSAFLIAESVRHRDPDAASVLMECDLDGGRGLVLLGVEDSNGAETEGEQAWMQDDPDDVGALAGNLIDARYRGFPSYITPVPGNDGMYRMNIEKALADEIGAPAGELAP